jgi:hypothetical protein
MHPDPKVWDRWYQYVPLITVEPDGCAKVPAPNHDGEKGQTLTFQVVWLSDEDARTLTDREERAKGEGLKMDELPAGRIVLGSFRVSLP